MYLLGIEVERLVNKTFDEMQRLGQLKYTTSQTLFNFLVFVVYKINGKEEKKGRAIVNIYKLNDLVILDAYPLFLQSDIIASVQECINLVVLDVVSFFYQWLLHLDHQYIFIIISY